MNYKVTNLSKDVRKFRDRNGMDILLSPGKTVTTTNPPQESDIWKVQIYTEKTEEIKLKKEVTSKKMEKQNNGLVSK